jgi:AcrR family transcriptional regulator
LTGGPRGGAQASQDGTVSVAWRPLADTVEDAQRARLLEGLAAAIREKGLAQTHLGDIARHARTSRRTFYKHFPDKESAFIELVHILGEAMQAQVEQVLDPDLPLGEQMDRAIATYVELITADPAVRITFANPLLTDRVMRAQREGAERYAHLIVRVVHDAAGGDPRISPISFASAYMATRGIHEAMVRSISRGENVTELVPELQRFLRSVARVDTAATVGARPAA